MCVKQNEIVFLSKYISILPLVDANYHVQYHSHFPNMIK